MIAAASAAWLAGIAANALAAASLPWMPDAINRHRLTLLVDDAGLQLPLGQWPLPHEAVVRALDTLPARLPDPLADARDAVRAALRAADAAGGTLSARNSREALAGFGDEANPGHALTLRSHVFTNDAVAARLSLHVEENGDDGTALRDEGTALVAEALGIRLQAWSGHRWWGPGWQSSLILGNNAAALDGVGIQRAEAVRSRSPWLAWLGPWNLEMFAARLQGVQRPAHPWLLGTRLTVRPIDGLEIGLTRTAQWGGEGRPRSFTSLVDAAIGTGLNADTEGQQARDPANELGGFDLRLRCPSGVRCAGYLQLIGEDEAGHMPSHNLGLYGLEAWSADGRYRGFVEYAETGCRMPIGYAGIAGCAYRNFAYPEGYVNRGRWLGASVGPDSRLLTVGWTDADRGLTLRAHAGRVGARIGRFTPSIEDSADAGRLLGIAGQWTVAWSGLRLRPELAWTQVRTSAGVFSEIRIGVTVAIDRGADD